MADWTQRALSVADKLFVARSTPYPQDDPFRSLGDDRLFAVASLWQTPPSEWAMLLNSPRPPSTGFGNRGQLEMDATGASTARALSPAIQRNPVLVPNYMVHAELLRGVPMPDAYRGQMGSPIPFTLMPTRVRNPSARESTIRALMFPQHPSLLLAHTPQLPLLLLPPSHRGRSMVGRAVVPLFLKSFAARSPRG